MTHVLVEHFRKHRLLAIIRTDSARCALGIGRSIIAGGVRLVEVTLDTPGAEQVVGELRLCGDEVLVGCGTVLTPEAARRAIGWGAHFIVSPHTDVRIIEVARAAGVLAMSGALTPNEIVAAYQAGADLIKIFPIAPVGGLAYLNALRGPFSDLPLVPTGGIGEADFADYLGAGALAVGVGHSLAPEREVAKGRWSTIANRASEWLVRLGDQNRTSDGCLAVPEHR
ncbi:bifunctional 4-hydroxy-2-oxoglutarate aldolase/2-dehydro-3-deoxy-phosphogluconate aldolase [Gloeobacter kilaueensis]|uniref:2-dehydro-3-deoxyphosphogluconate aldolase/4-hydroxy-2-oxoglutarate aldolase n=1 Tax=Gloeobacter kilaueensis (strain ATCC BAA-2537 / CCAP 1431/1 / ULC 316 / JS1) TaxID=1183438 RepID=U5QE12_GLOK1|nr:bifunctional 4-hydroxy-2-oxoglutarate aldolase/2-dehydro-3-deoxy-phosphogluconate aldolase [Gloeobacter kilaueensis]AGY57202.1 2-dehydro-3-deoxyphosphogluconate aldolase/4-hydroxy-2-oxoglutarate aldolase [Gloeobacter kilaueensis JS1]